MLPKGECWKISAEVNSMTGAQSDWIGTGVHGSDPVAGDESGGPMTSSLQEVGSVLDSNADKCAASMAGSIHPSSNGAVCSGLIPGAAAGAISRTLSDGRSKSCAWRSFGAPDMGSNPSKIKSLQMSAV